MLAMDNNIWPCGDFLDGDDDSNRLSIDLQTLFAILGESPDPQQSAPEDLSSKIVSRGGSVLDVINHENSLSQNGFQEVEAAPSSGVELPVSLANFPSCNSEASDSKTGASDGSFESAGNSMVFDYGTRDSSSQIGSPINSYSGNLKEWMPPIPGHGLGYLGRIGVHQNDPSYGGNDSKEREYEIFDFNSVFSFDAGDANPLSDFTDDLDLDYFKGKCELLPGVVGGNGYCRDAVHSPDMDTSDVNFKKQGALSENNVGSLGAPEKYSCTSMEISLIDSDISSHNATHTLPSVYQISDDMCETSNHYSAMQFSMNEDSNHLAGPSVQSLHDSGNHHFVPTNGKIMINMNNEKEFLTDNIWLSSKMPSIARVGRADNKASRQSLTCPRSYLPRKKEETCIKGERNTEIFSPERSMSQSVDAIDEVVSRQLTPDVDGFSSAERDLKPSLPGTLPPNYAVHASVEKNALLAAKQARHSTNILLETARINCTDGHVDVKASGKMLYHGQPSATSNQLFCKKEEREGKPIQPKSMGPHVLQASPEFIYSNSVDCQSSVDDSDICILEDISEPARSNPYRKPLITPQRSSLNDSLHHVGVGGMRLKANDERLIFQAALHDLSQPKSETSPPDGVLAVPLLRHQRIALSWMVHKETASIHCCGGILADDQGLGKTISTIALILKERPPSSKFCDKDMKQGELETLNLDDEDDGIAELDGLKQDADSCRLLLSESTMTSRNAFVQAKGRPAAGTLVVCPTSVLRQWAEELHNKVTSKANLSVLVYHGSSRTKDPCELAKYDVVLTTYSIVSMEVPKQPLVDKDDDERGKLEAGIVPHMGLPSSKKRKYPPSSDKGCLKGRKGVDSALLECTARPLAKVGWFRVVLDEAQSIKNHRTQVARACWGLRAKRRWCLSGTPIQNAVDDLYSYFRFLRYDPYAAYKSFCSTIKVPITRNPANGYRKLQAVLKTIMLRRTKGTILDGEPIITLPPKSIELKRVDFSKEERDFYSRLEADSRAQFEVYAAAGTVKQNYVNILLMLLRLRQACDHPLLVKGYDSHSVWKTSVETARKLPRERQICLLNCLEASLAICGVCNDPPEDAVVSICGHVFCNQCICEHLTGDDHQCPTANCKVQLATSSVFSKATLNGSLCDQSGPNNSIGWSGSELVEVLEPCSVGHSFDSSKIRAALEVLESLSKPRDCRLRKDLSKATDEIAICPENSSDHFMESPEDISNNRNLVGDNGLNDSFSVVGEKAIVFSQWTRMLDLLEDCLKNSSIQYRRLDGTMSVVARDKAVKDFNSLPEVSVMIMSLKAASLGLNMVAACHVLLLDLWWNPTTEDQAIDRAHRIGQTRPVTVVRLTVKDTVEDRILALQQKKREMVASAFGEDETGSRQTRLTVEDLKFLFMV